MNKTNWLCAPYLSTLLILCHMTLKVISSSYLIPADTRKPFFRVCEQQTPACQSAPTDQHLDICFFESIIYLLATGEISIFHVSVTVETYFSMACRPPKRQGIFRVEAHNILSVLRRPRSRENIAKISAKSRPKHPIWESGRSRILRLHI